jgi:predicted ATPase/DNA-binding XRE family transcriptional regulator
MSTPVVHTPPDRASALAVFGGCLRRFRLRRGFTQGDLAEQADVSRATIASLEQGQRSHPHVRTVSALADALQLGPVDRAAFMQLASAAMPTQRATRTTLTPEPNTRLVGGHVPLPVPATTLVAREVEIEGARELLHPTRSRVRLLTLHGPAGVGKTRLALAVAKAAGGEYADGVVFVDLAPLREHRLVAAKIAWAMGLHETSNQSARDLLLAQLANRQVLLVLDNFEHLLEAGPLLSDILAACPRVAMLVTSRARLGLRGEQRFVVEPLVSPAADPEQSVATIAATSAVRLFVERSREVSPSFVLSAANATAVAEICRRLDGLPLCLELAAGRTGLLSPEEILRRLDHRLSLLTNGPLDVPERQQTLRHTLEWSYQLLTTDEQRLFRHLAVFAGGCTLEAAQMMLAGESTANQAQPPEQVLYLVASLLDKSLVRRADNDAGTPRLVLLETIREYGLDQLLANGEVAAARNSHLEWCLQLAEPLQPDRTDPLEVALLEQEQDNFRAALRWCIETGQAARGMRLAERMWLFWYMRGRWAEGRAWVGELLALPAAQQPSPERAAALAVAGQLALDQSDYGAAEALLVDGQRLAEQVGDEHTRALCLYYRASAARVRGESPAALSLFEQSLEVSQRLDDAWYVAMTLQSMATVTFEMGDLERAEELANIALALFRGQGHFWGVGRSMALLGRSAQHRELHPQARQFFTEALSIQRQQADGQGMTWSMLSLFRTALAQSDFAEARQLLEESLAQALELGDRLSVARGFETVAVAAVARQPSAAILLVAAASSLREALHSEPYPLERGQLDRCLAAGRGALNADAFDAALRDGKRLRLVEVVAEALRAVSSLEP